MRYQTKLSVLLFAAFSAGLPAATPAWASEGSLGFPQLDPSTYASQVFWLFVFFVLLYVMMSTLALPRVGKALDTRKSYKEERLGDAGKFSEEAEKVKKEYERSLEKAQQESGKILAKAELEISEQISDAEARFAENSRNRLTATEKSIDEAKIKALDTITKISSEIAVEMVSKIADVQVSSADAQKAVTEAMKEA